MLVIFITLRLTHTTHTHLSGSGSVPNCWQHTAPASDPKCPNLFTSSSVCGIPYASLLARSATQWYSPAISPPRNASPAPVSSAVLISGMIWMLSPS